MPKTFARASSPFGQPAQQVLALQTQNTKLVTEVRDLVEKEYRVGQTSLVRLNEAQRDLVEAVAELALARVRLRLAWEELDAATGRNLTLVESGAAPAGTP